ncbi:MAG: hypothetical protein DI535_04045 [Citrobacter freundii]|nr:MAG: hypothetical protein DI535_04045 [Citrobacter freundii]
MLFLLQVVIKLLRLSVFQQFLLSILIPCCGIIFFDWLPGAVLFYFMLELVNYWLCNLILLLWFAKAASVKERWKQAGIFSFWNWVSLIGFYLFVAFMSDPESASMTTNITYGQMLMVTLIYWSQFAFFLYSARPKNKVTQDAIIKEVSYRLTGIYLTIFCVIMYFFTFWTHTETMNYALAVVLVFAKGLADLVLIALRINKEQLKVK